MAIPPAPRDPAEVGERVRQVLSATRYNQGIERDTWVMP